MRIEKCPFSRLRKLEQGQRKTSKKGLNRENNVQLMLKYLGRGLNWQKVDNLLLHGLCISKKSYSIQTSLLRQDHFTSKPLDATLMSERFAVFENNMSLKMSKIAH